MLWGIWTLVMIAVFDMVSGTLHSYYTVLLAPGVAALAAAGAVDLWSLGRRRRSFSWILPAAIAGTAVLSASILGRVSGYAPGLATTVLVLGALGAAGTLALLLMPGALPAAGARRSPVRKTLAGCVIAVSVVALLAGPLAYSASTISRDVTGNMAAAGPAASSATSGDSDLAVDQGLLTYLEQNQGDTKYLVAVQATAESVPIILATGEPVVTIGGYKSRDPYPTAAEIEQMVAAGELKYVLLTSSSSAKNAGSSSVLARETLQAVTAWIKANGTIVDSSAYAGSAAGTLYLLGG
jgi:4-amino-4-deoxy-L-arabinose transferase-like glycosyltransferase